MWGPPAILVSVFAELPKCLLVWIPPVCGPTGWNWRGKTVVLRLSLWFLKALKSDLLGVEQEVVRAWPEKWAWDSWREPKPAALRVGSAVNRAEWGTCRITWVLITHIALDWSHRSGSLCRFIQLPVTTACNLPWWIQYVSALIQNDNLRFQSRSLALQCFKDLPNAIFYMYLKSGSAATQIYL